MVSVAICDDLKSEREALKGRIKQFSEENDVVFRIDEYSSGEELLKRFGRQYDLIFLDIEMDGMDGLSTAWRIRQTDTIVTIFFSTQHNQYAYDSFALEPVGYVLKSEVYSVFAERLKKAIAMMRVRKTGIVVSFQGEKRYLELGRILYLEYFEHCVIIRMVDGTSEKSRESFKDILNQAKEGVLLQISRNTAVNLLWIDECQDGYIKLKSVKRKFDVTLRKRRKIENLYIKHCRKSML